jgi:hypothetical protein
MSSTWSPGKEPPGLPRLPGAALRVSRAALVDRSHASSRACVRSSHFRDFKPRLSGATPRVPGTGLVRTCTTGTADWGGAPGTLSPQSGQQEMMGGDHGITCEPTVRGASSWPSLFRSSHDRTDASDALGNSCRCVRILRYVATSVVWLLLRRRTAMNRKPTCPQMRRFRVEICRHLLWLLCRSTPESQT